MLSRWSQAFADEEPHPLLISCPSSFWNYAISLSWGPLQRRGMNHSCTSLVAHLISWATAVRCVVRPTRRKTKTRPPKPSITARIPVAEQIPLSHHLAPVDGNQLRLKHESILSARLALRQPPARLCGLCSTFDANPLRYLKRLQAIH